MADSIEGASSPKLNQKFAVELGAWLQRSVLATYLLDSTTSMSKTIAKA